MTAPLPPPAPEPRPVKPAQRKDIVIGLLASLLPLPLFVLLPGLLGFVFGTAPFFDMYVTWVPLAYLASMVVMLVWGRRVGRPGITIGVAIGFGIVVLLVGACFAFVFYTFRGF